MAMDTAEVTTTSLMKTTTFRTIIQNAIEVFGNVTVSYDYDR